MANQMPGSIPAATLVAKKKLSADFFRKGITVVILSGMCYGLYSAFLTLGTTKGVWVDSYSPVEISLAMVILLGALGSAINDTFSAIWAGINSAIQGKLGDFFRTLNTKPGRVMIIAALIGGPISSTAYLVGLNMAGSIVIPITALCPAIRAILGRILFKQELNKRMMLGIAICVFASFLIGSTSVGADAPPDRFLGLCIAFIAALGWGIEGCVAGYGTSMIDSQIGITIRQATSGLENLLILLPIVGIFVTGSLGFSFEMVASAVTDGSSVIFFVISGFFALFAYSLWYKGNSMCGAALGMACIGAYAFWGPFFCWIILGVFAGIPGWDLPPIAWIAAILMIFGILTISMNPLDLFRRKKGVN